MKTIFLKTAFIVLLSFFFVEGGMAQSKKSKASKSYVSAQQEKEEKAEQEEPEYYWTYTIMELKGEPGQYRAGFDKSSGEAYKKSMSQDEESEKAMKSLAQTGWTFTSEAEFLNAVGQAGFELVSISSERTKEGQKKSFYFKRKVEKLDPEEDIEKK